MNSGPCRTARTWAPAVALAIVSSVATTLSASIERSTTMAGHSRVYSSTMFNNFNVVPSAVWSNWKSSAHNTFGRDRDRTHRRGRRSLGSGFLRFRYGTRRPSSRHRRRTRLLLTSGPLDAALRGASPSPPRPVGRERAQPRPQLDLVVVGDRWRLEALGGTVLADDPTRSPLRDPEPFAQHRHSAARVRGQNFPSASSLSIALSSSSSATSFFRPGVLDLEFLQALRVVGFHAAVLVEPAMTRRLRRSRDDDTPRRAPSRRPIAVALGELADDLLRRVPASLHRRVVVAPLFESRTTTGPLRGSHLSPSPTQPKSTSSISLSASSPPRW